MCPEARRRLNRQVQALRPHLLGCLAWLVRATNVPLAMEAMEAMVAMEAMEAMVWPWRRRAMEATEEADGHLLVRTIIAEIPRVEFMQSTWAVAAWCRACRTINITTSINSSRITRSITL